MSYPRKVVGLLVVKVLSDKALAFLFPEETRWGNGNLTLRLAYCIPSTRFNSEALTVEVRMIWMERGRVR